MKSLGFILLLVPFGEAFCVSPPTLSTAYPDISSTSIAAHRSTRLLMAEDGFDLNQFEGPKKGAKKGASAASTTKSKTNSTGSATAAKSNGTIQFNRNDGVSQFTNKTAMHIPGIGGLNGHSYNVNKLKTNLVQQAVVNYKKELWDLLGTPDSSQCAIEDKLASLVQANPVYTTTDSNLLEGQWEFVFDSKKPASVLMDQARFKLDKKKKKTNKKLSKSVEDDTIVGITDHGGRRYILEDLEKSQDPFVVDCKRYLFGLSRVQYYRVKSLTRTSLDLDIFRVSWRFLGWPIWRRHFRTLNNDAKNVRILYVDTDLCISTDRSLEGPFTVYTKSPEWVARTQQLKRKWKKMRSRVQHAKSRLGIGGPQKDDFFSAIPPREPTMWVEYSNDQARLRVVKLGGVDGEEDIAWEGEMDPFVHLTADERQRILKQLKVREIEDMGKKQQEETSKSKKKSIVLERKKTFQKPKFDQIDVDFLQE